MLWFLSPRFHVAEQGSFRDQVNVHTPATAQAGATVTLTLTVRALDSADSNYAVAYLTVVPPVRSINWKLIRYIYSPYLSSHTLIITTSLFSLAGS